LSKIVPDFISNIPDLEKTEVLIQIIFNINIFDWNKVRELWVFNIINSPRNLKTISLFGSEYSSFLSHIGIFQKYKLQQQCSVSCAENNRLLQVDSTELYFRKNNNNELTIFSSFSNVCYTCENIRSINVRFDYNPNFIFFQINNVNGMAVLTDAPKNIIFDNTEFKLLCVTIHQTSPSHFLGIYDINNSFYAVDDLDQSVRQLPNPNIGRNGIYGKKPRRACTTKYNFILFYFGCPTICRPTKKYFEN